MNESSDQSEGGEMGQRLGQQEFYPGIENGIAFSLPKPFCDLNIKSNGHFIPGIGLYLYMAIDTWPFCEGIWSSLI